MSSDPSRHSIYDVVHLFLSRPAAENRNRLLYVTEKTTEAVMLKRRMEHSPAMQKIDADVVDEPLTQ